MSSRLSPAWVSLACAAAGFTALLLWLGPPPGRGAASPPARHPQPDRREAAPRGSAPDALARLAVVIDDVGYELRPVRDLLSLKARLSFAVIPHQRYSRQAAELAHREGQEVLIHLPMEPREYPDRDPGQGALLGAMEAQELRWTVRQALRAVPHARGLSNHMGSRLTAEPAAMRLLMEELGQRRLYFLDSRTGPGSVALSAARAAGVPCLQRHVFLDARPERVFIESQLRRAAERARERGVAVAIAHPHPVTLDVLRRELPRLKAQGVRLVFASELAS